MMRAALVLAGALAIAPASAATLYSQADFVTAPGAASDGADISAMQADLDARYTGHAANAVSRTRVAEDFVVPGNGWRVTRVVAFGFQPGSVRSVSPLEGLQFRLWNGIPDTPGASVVFGDLGTERFGGSTFAGAYRTSGRTGDLSRPIFAVNSAPISIDLAAGTYWLEWQLDGVRPGGPYVPSNVIPSAAANARQWRSGSWSALVDGGTPVALPFRIEGVALDVGGVPPDPLFSNGFE